MKKEPVIDLYNYSINGIRTGERVYFDEITPMTGQIARRVTGELKGFTENGAVYVEETKFLHSHGPVPKTKKTIHVVDHEEVKKA